MQSPGVGQIFMALQKLQSHFNHLKLNPMDPTANNKLLDSLSLDSVSYYLTRVLIDGSVVAFQIILNFSLP